MTDRAQYAKRCEKSMQTEPQGRNYRVNKNNLPRPEQGICQEVIAHKAKTG
jgi:hypothetical protein